MRRLGTRLSVVTVLAAATTAQTPEWVGIAGERLKEHPFFSRIAYTTVTDFAPFAFFVQRPPRDQDNYERTAAERYVAWLRELEQRFLDDYAKPLKLARRLSVQGYAFAVLASRGDYDNYARAVESSGLHAAVAHYDPELELAVTWEAVFVDRSEGKRRRAVLHEYVHALQHAYFAESDGMPRPVWFNEGLAEYLATCSGNKPEDLRTSALDDDHVDAFVKALHDPIGHSLIHSVRDLIAINGPGYAGVVRRARRRAPEDFVLGAEYDSGAIGLFYAQSALFMHFLHEVGGGRYRAQFLQYMDATMSGLSGRRPFEEAFASVDLDDLEREFLEYVLRAYRKRHPREVLPDYAPLQTVGANDSDIAARTPVGEFDPSSLSLDEVAAERLLAAAVCLAKRGRLAAALALLEPRREADERLAREWQRLSSLSEFRAQALASAKKNKKSIPLVLDGKKTTVRIEDLSEASVGLRIKKEQRTVALESIDAASLYQVRLRTAQGPASRDWLAAYALLLSGGDAKKVAKKLRGKDEECVSLLGELGEYEGITARGEAVALIASIAGRPLPPAGAEAAQCLQELRGVLAEHGNGEFLAGRRKALKSYAKALLDRSFGAPGSELPLRGAVTKKQGDTIEVHYDFSDPEQLRDFAPDLGYLKTYRAALGQLEEPGKSKAEVREGSLYVNGSRVLRHVLPLTVPFRVSYKIVWPSSVGPFWPMVCDDGKGNHVSVELTGALTVQDAKRHVYPSPPKNPLEYFRLEEPYTYEITRNDKGRVRCSIDGDMTDEKKCRLPPTGEFVLWSHTPVAVEIREVTIETQLDQQALAKMKKSWIDGELERMFQ